MPSGWKELRDSGAAVVEGGTVLAVQNMRALRTRALVSATAERDG
jgi:hypothetical protein